MVVGGGSLMSFLRAAWEQAGKWFVRPKSGFTVPLSPTDTTWLSALANPHCEPPLHTSIRLNIPEESRISRTEAEAGRERVTGEGTPDGKKRLRVSKSFTSRLLTIQIPSSFSNTCKFVFSVSAEITSSVAEVYHRGAESWRVRGGGGITINNKLAAVCQQGELVSAFRER